MSNYKKIKLDEAIGLNYSENLENHKKYMNSGLVDYLSLVDLYRRYVKAKGSSLWDEQGNEYLDFLGGYGSLNIGHNHPKVIEAMDKVKELPNLMQASFNPLAGALAHNLAQITPGELQRSFFCNSGAEAVEAAVKLAKASTCREKIIYCDASFHGKTLGSLSFSGREKYKEAFYPLLNWGCKIPFGSTEILEDSLKDRQVAAFMVEPIQGEGGIIIPPQGYLKKVREICDRYNTLLILDEIQTGMGRTGKMFAFEEEGVVPDILCLAKSLGGGIMPVGAMITTDLIWQKAYGSIDKCLIHTTTFGGNTWAMASCLAALEVIEEEGLAQQAQEKGVYILEKLEGFKNKYDLVKDVRGRGLLIGVELNSAEGTLNKISGGLVKNLSKDFTGALITGELLNRYNIIVAYTLNNPNVIRLEPPLNISYEQIDYMLDSLEKVLTKNKGFLSLASKSSKSLIRGSKHILKSITGK
ncbi:aspartate aminotransferase family protein [Candidatus Contubernalis alkaliaceticus]|uniref:aspartate aminotransferase family protein n=1 Tax=Candidatus Contubernalis alkaliaceticus TaxID=338645 RepID=UPI001F4BFC37|nr:aspartate aminotransferase family protein [Candidatus Contubernalis alkalaceticus]UNC91913.1 aspartate aminotransferase family protein [Candidatus Contubernalis alkalaceticus]